MTTDQTALAQRSQQKLHFDHKDMDYYYAWIRGREIYGGSQAAECAAAVAQISNGDPVSWQRAWVGLAQRLQAEATSQQHGDNAVARAAYLRACTYYRAPLFISRPTDPAFHSNWRSMQFCFRQAAALFDPPIEPIRVPFQGRWLPGYSWKVDNSDQPRPTLIVIGGIETFAEDCYFMVGPAGPQRGYNVITVDLPGQGMNPDQGLFFEARMGSAVSAVVDYALAQPFVDPQRLALFGFSWGGHVVFKAAVTERRIKALIANPAMPDVFRAARAQQANHGSGDVIGRLVIDQIAWRMGLKISFNPGDIGRRFAKAYDYLMFGKARPADISCPTLCLAGEGEAQITLDVAQECYAQLPHPLKKLVIFTQAEGGAAHCQIDNLALPNRVIFDWLDQVFA